MKTSSSVTLFHQQLKMKVFVQIVVLLELCNYVMMDCSVPDPQNGKVNVKAVYTCDPGYTKVGQDRHYRSNTWYSTNAPTCQPVDCGVLQYPSHGQVVEDKTTFGGIANYSCDGGYVLTGTANRTCQANGTWSNVEPTCQPIDCDNLTDPVNGHVSAPRTTFGNTASYQCDLGYELSGPEQRYCQENKTWSVQAPTCTVVNCGTPGNPVNGQVNYNDTTYRNTANYTCDTGYLLNGQNTRVCQANLSWSGSEAFCEAVDCGPLSHPAHGQVTTNQTTFLGIAAYDCSLGYEMEGSSARDCQADGKWSGAVPDCYVVDCDTLGKPAHGQVHYSDTTYGNTANYTCDEGYLLEGQNIRVCQADMLWSGQEAMCSAVDCGSLHPPPNGLVAFTTTTFGSTGTYNCNWGYELSGSENKTCRADGTWSEAEPICENAVPGYQLIENSDCNGNDINSTNVQTSQECAALCQQTGDCIAFVIDVRNRQWRCFLKHICGAVIDKKSVHTFKQAPVLYKFDKRPSTECVGIDMESFVAIPSQCATACITRPNCVTFTTRISDNMCQLMSQCRRFIKKSGMTAYSYTYTAVLDKFNKLDNKDCVGNDIKNYVSNPGNCAMDCSVGEADCVAFLIRSSDSRCWLKRACNSLTNKTGSAVYAYKNNSALETAAIDKFNKTEDYDCLGNDLAFFEATPGQCARSCVGNYLCVAFLVRHADNKCWLKSVCDSFTYTSGLAVYVYKE